METQIDNDSGVEAGFLKIALKILEEQKNNKDIHFTFIFKKILLSGVLNVALAKRNKKEQIRFKDGKIKWILRKIAPNHKQQYPNLVIDLKDHLLDYWNNLTKINKPKAPKRKRQPEKVDKATLSSLKKKVEENFRDETNYKTETKDLVISSLRNYAQHILHVDATEMKRAKLVEMIYSELKGKEPPTKRKKHNTPQSTSSFSKTLDGLAQIQFPIAATTSAVLNPTFSVDPAIDNLFKDAKCLSQTDRETILQFLLNTRTNSIPEKPVQQFLFNLEKKTNPETNAPFMEKIVFEINYETGKWRKLRQKAFDQLATV